MGGIFQIANSGLTNIQYDCCKTDLCNSNDLIKKKLSSSCEFGKEMNDSAKLLFPVKISSKTNVKKCYVCESCTSFKAAQIVTCANRYKVDEKFACQVRDCFI